MTTKDEINKTLREKLGNEEFVRLWWRLRLPAFGGKSANEIFEQNPQQISDYVKEY